MKGAAKISIVSSLAGIFALGNSWQKAQQAKERLEEENKTLQSIIEVSKEKELYVGKGRAKKEVISNFDNKLEELNQTLSTLKNQVSEKSFLDHLDNLTQNLLNNYIEVFQKNFFTFSEFFSKLTPSNQLIMVVLMISILSYVLLFIFKRLKSNTVPVEQENKEKISLVVNFYNPGEPKVTKKIND